MTVIRHLRVQNVKRIVEADVDTAGESVVTVSGLNAQGKQQPVSEPVLTPDGWRPIGDLAVGDFVVGRDGHPTKVVAVHPQDSREVWRVTFGDGSSTRCGPEHLWLTQRTVFTKVKGAPGRTAEELLTTAEMVRRGYRINQGRSRKYGIPIVDAVHFEQGPGLPVDPWTLGVILGDGHIINERGYVAITSDVELLERMADGRKIHPHRSEGIGVLGSGKWTPFITAEGLAGCRSHEKFVPTEYLTASVADRRALLAGLLDTDGWAPPSGYGAEFSSTSPHLVAAVVELTRGLGGIATAGPAAFKAYTAADGSQVRSTKPSWRVHVKTPFNPFTLRRKMESWNPCGDGKARIRRYIDSIEPDGLEDCVCIEVAAEDGLYVTNDYIVTHNSSLIDSVWLALSGQLAGKDTPDPLRDGEDEGFVEVTLDGPQGPMVVCRTYRRREDGTVASKLTVGNGQGASYSSPQTLLDGMLGSLTFDPLAFTRLTAKEQVRLFLQLADPDFDPDELDREYAQAYDERRHVNRDLRETEAQLERLAPIDDTVPLSEVSSAEALAAIDAAQEQVRSNQQVRDRHASMRAHAERLASQVVDLQRQLDLARQELAAAEETLSDFQAEVDALPADPDVTELTEQIAELERTNATVRANNERRKAEDRLALLVETSQTYTAQLEAINTRRAEAVAKADLGVPNLSMTEDGLTLNGHPFMQASAAEQLRVAMAVSLRLSPGLPIVRITDGSLLDDESMAIVEQMAEAAGAQVWLEVVSADAVGVHIEDGVVVA